jgi:hypothetical protein
MNKHDKYIEHSTVECVGFDIVDTSDPEKIEGERVWVGCGEAGRWLKASQVRELAQALLDMAKEHEARLVDDTTEPEYLAAMDRENS